MDEAVLKQFEILWAEIGRRSHIQQALIAGTAAIAGSLGGLVASGKADRELLLVLAIVAPTFGLLWLDHARSIYGISVFIGREWEPKINWEASRRGKGRASLFVFIPAVTMVFLGPSVGGLIASVDHVSRVVWFSAAALSLTFLIGMGVYARTLWLFHSPSPQLGGR